MATVFWDSDGVFLVDYFEKGKTIIGEDYANLLNELKKNANIDELRFELLRHSPYFPDLCKNIVK